MTDASEKGPQPEQPKEQAKGAEHGKGGFGQHAERYRERWAASHPGAPKRDGQPAEPAPATPPPAAGAPDESAAGAPDDAERGGTP